MTDNDHVDAAAEMGRRLRDAREAQRLTQEAVSVALGIPRSSIPLIEAGRRNVTAPELKLFSRLYQRSVEWILGEPEPSVSADAALHRAAGALSPGDREQVLKFAQFLASRSKP
jgi:transcriptional regulator with XRE-family HTH domain